MSRVTRRVVAMLAILGVALSVALIVPLPAVAGGSPSAERSAGNCPTGMVCNMPIGVVVRLPGGWGMAPGQFPFNTLAVARIVPGRPDLGPFLTIEPFGTTILHDPLAAASAGADAVTQGMARPAIRTVTTIAGIPALVLHGAPGPPGLYIIVAHDGLLYGIAASPATTLTSDLWQVLASLRFVQHLGPALRPYDTNPVIAAGYNPCLDTGKAAPMSARLFVTFSISRSSGNDGVGVTVTGTGFRPRETVALMTCWNRAIRPTYALYQSAAPVHADRQEKLTAPANGPTLYIYVPSGAFHAWDIRVVATDGRTGRRLAAVNFGPTL